MIQRPNRVTVVIRDEEGLIPLDREKLKKEKERKENESTEKGVKNVNKT